MTRHELLREMRAAMEAAPAEQIDLCYTWDVETTGAPCGCILGHAAKARNPRLDAFGIHLAACHLADSFEDAWPSLPPSLRRALRDGGLRGEAGRAQALAAIDEALEAVPDGPLP